MVQRKRPSSSSDPDRSNELVLTEPQLVPPGKYSRKHGVEVFQAVDYMGTRFHIGDHVAVFRGEGPEWVCVLEALFMSKEGQPKFKGRWFWSVADVASHSSDMRSMMRESKCAKHELISCDNRDANLVESFSRKCTILSWENFLLVRKLVNKASSRWNNVYYCDRQFYHRAHRFAELSAALFPGDPIPPELRAAAGLPELLPIGDGVQDMSQAYEEPEFSMGVQETELTERGTRRSSRSKPDHLNDDAKSEESRTRDPLLLW